MRRAYGLFKGKNIDVDIYSVQKQKSFFQGNFSNKKSSTKHKWIKFDTE